MLERGQGIGGQSPFEMCRLPGIPTLLLPVLSENDICGAAMQVRTVMPIERRHAGREGAAPELQNIKGQTKWDACQAIINCRLETTQA